MKTNYIPKINNIFIKLMKKVCNTKTSLNNTFTWFNRYNVIMESGCREFTSVLVTDMETDTIVANFEIDFALKKLTILSTHSNDILDFIISDSLIKSFSDIYSDTDFTIDSNDGWKEEYDQYKEILTKEEDYIPEYITEIKKYIEFCDDRKEWIENLS